VNKFTCIKPNQDGNIAISSAKGAIRLYDGIGKRAKNLYPGFGDEITNLDCSKDGKWLLATCAKYLLIIPTFA